MPADPEGEPGGPAFEPEARAALRTAFADDERLDCPSCGVPLDRTPVPPNPAVSYVRDRLLVTCPSCHRHLVLDRAERRR